MNLKRYKARIEHVLSQPLWRIALGAALVWTCAAALGATKERDELTTRLLIGDFRMYAVEVLRQDVLDRLVSNESENRITMLGNWVRAPFEVRDITTEGSIRIRFEDDYLVIWHHRTRALGNGRGDVLQLIREATEAVLAPPYAVGEPGMVVAPGRGGPSSTQEEIVMFDWPKEVPGIGTVSCGYYNGRLRQWRLIEVVRVLVKGQDTVIALEKSKPRQAGGKYVYEGLNAGKTRLTKEEAERLRSRPVLAKNAIFAKDVDVSKVPDALLNACMWPVEDAAVVGAKDMGPASQLRPQPENRENNQR
jgi:hypothetical protein